MKSVRPLSLGLTVGLLIGLLLAGSHQVFAKRDNAVLDLPLSDIQLFTDIYARIKKDYVEEVGDQSLLEGAIRGMLSSLDPHSSYLSQEEFRELQIGTTGEFGGLGIEVGMENGFVRVISPIEDTPADKAGVEAGDVIIKLDETQVKGLTLNEAVKLMRGKRGSKILLTIVREGEAKPLEISVTRDVIRVKSVRSRILEPGYGYIRISSFQSKTTRNVIAAVEKLLDKADQNLQGLVLDLRNNPGGVLTGAVGVSDIFLEDGELIVFTKGRVEDAELNYSASTNDTVNGAPIIVLINEGSASASEIVAGALQDHKRAVIMGQKSFGKGSVQTILPLKEDAALKLTTARYYTPSGKSIQGEGIDPDILVEELHGGEGEENKRFEFVREADLKGHLENNQEKGKAKQQKEVKHITIAVDSEEDAVLNEALSILKDLANDQDSASA
ncbi:MAG: S41 family peptidase [Gammaproteobacteria bacterium]